MFLFFFFFFGLGLLQIGQRSLFHSVTPFFLHPTMSEACITEVTLLFYLEQKLTTFRLPAQFLLSDIVVPEPRC